jgi:hypothetical protein
MKTTFPRYITAFTALAICHIAQASPELEELERAMQEVQARRARRSVSTDARIRSVIQQDGTQFRFVANEKFLVEWTEALQLFLKKEIVMTSAAASKRLTLETGVVSAAEAHALLAKKFSESELEMIELGDSSILVVTKSQLPKEKIRANQALEPTPTAVTDRAAHAPRQP